MKIAKSVNKLGTEAVYNIFAKTKKFIGYLERNAWNYEKTAKGILFATFIE